MKNAKLIFSVIGLLAIFSLPLVYLLILNPPKISREVATYYKIHGPIIAIGLNRQEVEQLIAIAERNLIENEIITNISFNPNDINEIFVTTLSSCGKTSWASGHIYSFLLSNGKYTFNANKNCSWVS